MADPLTTKGQPPARYFFRKTTAIGLFALGLAGALMLLFIAYYTSDPNWHYTGTRPSTRFIAKIMEALPWWLRAALYVGLAAITIRLFSRFLSCAFDRQPDFVIDQEGVSENSVFQVRKLAWSDIQSVTVSENRVRISAGAPPDAYREPIWVQYDPFIYSGTKDDVLAMIRRYRPDLVVNAEA